VVAHLMLPHGTCVIPQRQTNGVGRSNNQVCFIIFILFVSNFDIFMVF
jgi:hypothetical protein